MAKPLHTGADSTEQSDRLVRILRIIDQAEKISWNPEKAGNWLRRPTAPLVEQTPLPDEPSDEGTERPAETRITGNQWLRAGRTAVLRVPSAIVPSARNLLLNPLHARAADVNVVAVEPFQFDTRLWRATNN